MSRYVGTKIHRLTVLEEVDVERKGKKTKYFKCRCDCGTEKLIHGDGIRKKRTKSCGCWKREVDSQKAKNMGQSNYKHGMSRTRIYKIWDGMTQRCNNPNSPDYPHYGGRGITIDPKWSDSSLFLEDMSEGYESHLTIERLDVNGNYCKENCTWITFAEQQKNRRNSRKNRIKGIVLRKKVRA